MNALTDLRSDCCPLCGQPNQCAMEIERITGAKQPPCWCTQVDFGADLLARVPREKQRLACICAACARPDPRPASGED